jgi:putative transposase
MLYLIQQGHMFVSGGPMRAGQTVQSLSYALRLPDAVQGATLRLLDASRAVINATVAALWERLDDFGERETKYAYKQVTALIRVH